jgi:hypothetical protein
MPSTNKGSEFNCHIIARTVGQEFFFLVMKNKLPVPNVTKIKTNKSEIRISKSETISKFKCSKFKTKAPYCLLLSFLFWSFRF